MISTSARRAVVPAIAALALGASLVACGSDESPKADETTGTDLSMLSGEISGAGASSQEKAQEAWSTGFQGLTDGNVTVNYNPVGSGDGRKQFIAGGVLFAGTDSYFKDDEGELTAANERCGTDIIEVPAYVSPIAIILNVPGVKGLDLDADTIAQIFDNKITKWNDAKIAEQNPDVDLPDLAIIPVHRQDGSGTTKNFTDYLGKASESWSYKAEDAFPVAGGLAAEGTSGVVANVTEGKGTIGYADASQAGDLAVVSVKVGDTYQAPTVEAAAAIIGASTPLETNAASQLAVDIARDTTTAGSYPVVLVSYLVACQTYPTAAEADLVKGYLTFILGEDGQKAASEHAGSAPLDEETAKKSLAIVEKISAK